MTQDQAPSSDDQAPSSDDQAPRRVRFSRSPRYPVFLLSGAVVGLIAATVVAFAAPDPGDYSRGTLWGYLLVGLAVVGALLGGLAALAAEKVSRSGEADVTPGPPQRLPGRAPRPHLPEPATDDAAVQDEDPAEDERPRLDPR